MTVEGKEIFDITVYKDAEQLLGCVGCYKADDDRRELIPLDPSRLWSDYLVQHLQGDEVMVEFPVKPRKELSQKPESLPFVKAGFEKAVLEPSQVSYEELESLVASLSVARATDYEDWRNVGFALKSAVLAGIADAELLTLFDAFS